MKESEQPPKENKFSIGNQPDIISAGMEMFGKVEEPAHTVDKHLELQRKAFERFPFDEESAVIDMQRRAFIEGGKFIMSLSVSPSPERGESEGWIKKYSKLNITKTISNEDNRPNKG